jgi:threonine/homoserine/homoserine lactone efflux protein
LASSTLGGWLARRPIFPNWQERFAGAVMIALGIWLLITNDPRAAPEVLPPGRRR